jgi:hypothetical protein
MFLGKGSVSLLRCVVCLTQNHLPNTKSLNQNWINRSKIVLLFQLFVIGKMISYQTDFKSEKTGRDLLYILGSVLESGISEKYVFEKNHFKVWIKIQCYGNSKVDLHFMLSLFFSNFWYLNSIELWKSKENCF